MIYVISVLKERKNGYAGNCRSLSVILCLPPFSIIIRACLPMILALLLRGIEVMALRNQSFSRQSRYQMWLEVDDFATLTEVGKFEGAVR